MSFDAEIIRRGTGSLKWDQRPNLEPYWVADMDFASPPEVVEALRQRVEHGVFGYATPHDGLNEAVLNYLQMRFGYHAEVGQIVHLGGLVPALSLAARAFGSPGDELLTCAPVYPPFLNVARDAKMTTRRVAHILVDGRWTFDWELLEQSITAKTRVFLLCNPQNPLGRCFSSQEIIRIGEFCLKHKILLVSDEIHCDLILDEAKTPFFSALHLPDQMRQNTIVLLSPSKTYNIAGLGYAFAMIENSEIRNTFKNARGHTLSEINCLGYFAAEAAYRHGEAWRGELIDYLRGNRDLVTQFVGSELNGQVTIPQIEATYLAWMDCSSLPISDPARHLERERLYVSDGTFFGSPKHIRFNFGCSRNRVWEGLKKIKKGFASAI